MWWDSQASHLLQGTNMFSTQDKRLYFTVRGESCVPRDIDGCSTSAGLTTGLPFLS
jgi:hypothetical protein